MHRNLATWTLVVMIPLAGCLQGESDGGDADEELPVTGPVIGFSKIHHPGEIVERISEIAERPGVKVEHIGDSIEGRPLHLVSVGSGGFEVWIQGRIHGNEPTGAEAILLALDALTLEDAVVPDDAPESFRQLRDLRHVLLDRLTFHFIPVANPDGAAAYTRGNAMGTDLNRDFFAFAEPEPRLIAEAFWAVNPDGCIDLHNEGIGQTDWDAFNPDGPLIEPEVYAEMIDDVWYALLEVDAAGGRGGGPNEFYNLVQEAPVVGPVVNPTAYHPGTHDMFCSTRGAPGYTPEGAIQGGDNGATDDIHAWSTRLHQVTIAAAAFHWAGFYGPWDLLVIKDDVDLDGPAGITVETPGPLDALAQVVWRDQATANDFSRQPVSLSLRTPDGNEYTSGPLDERVMQWSQTVVVHGGPAGSYDMEIRGALPAQQAEWRFTARIHQDPLVEVHRQGQDLHVRALADVEFRITDSYDRPGHRPTDFAPTAWAVHAFNTTVDERVVVTWDLALGAGDERTLTGPEGRNGVGPFRFTATTPGVPGGTGGPVVHMGVEQVRNAPPDAVQQPPGLDVFTF